jgi:pimeloyl-ACP methyl ester carboxylesterase
MRAFDRAETTLVTSGASVIRYDLPGHGGSSLGRESQTLESCAEVLTGIGLAAKIQQPILFGKGFGAYLCLHAARLGHIRPRAILLWRPLLGPPSWGTQMFNQLTSLAVDRLSARTIETLWPTEPTDTLHTRARMTASIRALTEYATLLTNLPVIRLSDFDESFPILLLDRGQDISQANLGTKLSDTLQQIGLLNPHDP